MFGKDSHSFVGQGMQEIKKGDKEKGDSHEKKVGAFSDPAGSKENGKQADAYGDAKTFSQGMKKKEIGLAEPKEDCQGKKAQQNFLATAYNRGGRSIGHKY